MIGSAALGATLTWDNFDSIPESVWSDRANWLEDIAPTSGDSTLVLKFGGGSDPYSSRNDIPDLRLAKMILERSTGGEAAILGDTLDFRSTEELSIDQRGAGAFSIQNELLATNLIVFAGAANTGLVTLNGSIGGAGGVRFDNGNWKLTNTSSSFTGGMVIRLGATVEVAPAAPVQHVDMTPAPLSSFGGNAAVNTLAINGGTLKLTTSAFGSITLSLARRINFGANGGLLDLTNFNTEDPTIQGGHIAMGDLSVGLNPSGEGVIRFNGGQLGLSSNSATDGNWNANGNTLRIPLLANSGKLRVELDNGAYYSASAAPLGRLTVRGKLSGDPTSGPAGLVNTGIGRNFGRFGTNDANTVGFSGGLRFEDAVEVSIPGASRLITGNITIAGSAGGHPGYVAFSGRATGSGNQLTADLTLPGFGGSGQNVLHVGSSPINSDILTIETGGAAVFDARLRIEQAVNHGVLLNSQTIVERGGLLRFAQSMSNFNFDPSGLSNAQTNANVGDIIVRGRIVGRGNSANEAVVEILLPAPVAGAGEGTPEVLTSIPVAPGARPFGGLRFVDSGDANAVAGVNQDVVVNGSGFGGLKFTASARPNSLFGGGIADPVGNDAKPHIAVAPHSS